MPAYDTTVVSDADLGAIVDWLDAMPKPSDGGGLYGDFCEYCHGPEVPQAPDPTHARGIYYVKPNIDMAELDWQSFLMHIRNGAPAADAAPATIDQRRRYMPPFADTLLTDSEAVLIAQWICDQYSATPLPMFCSELP
jgi:mono/diheme cytochrome c family protein